MVDESAPTRSDRPKPGRRERGRTVLMLALTALVSVFAVLNVGRVSVNWIVATWHAPLIVVIAVTLLAGVVLGALGRRASRRGH